MSHIQISANTKNAIASLEIGMERINQAAKNKLQWKRYKSYDCYETECDLSEEDIVSVFHELIIEYPSLDIHASYSCDIREDDSSAQWWRTTEIKTVHHPDGTTTLDITSSTQWF